MLPPTLHLERVPNAEIVHYASAYGLITSNRNTVRCEINGNTSHILQFRQAYWKNLAQLFRPIRRLLRLDKVVVVPVATDDRWTALIVVRDGNCYHVDLASEHITHTLALRQSRNPLHQSICRSGNGWYFQGEYGSNPKRLPVPVYCSKDSGQSWQLVFEFPGGKARHIHGCFWDPFEEKVWVCTGDFEDENHLLVTDEDFSNLEWLGDGNQSWRTCHLLFTEDSVYWGMDSQLETSYLCRFNRATRQMEKIKELPGPVWYAKQLTDGRLLLATVVENGPGVHEDHAHIFTSLDGTTWDSVYKAKKDSWPMPHFKNGVINFADGPQDSDAFYFSAEALYGIDGRVFKARLIES